MRNRGSNCALDAIEPQPRGSAHDPRLACWPACRRTRPVYFLYGLLLPAWFALSLKRSTAARMKAAC